MATLKLKYKLDKSKILDLKANVEHQLRNANIKEITLNQSLPNSFPFNYDIRAEFNEYSSVTCRNRVRDLVSYFDDVPTLLINDAYINVSRIQDILEDMFEEEVATVV